MFIPQQDLQMSETPYHRMLDFSLARWAVRSQTHTWALLHLTILCTFLTCVAHGGLVPSEVVVVVNGDSLDSRTVANHYIALRNIPPANVIVLDDVPNSEVVKIDEFREKILKPLLFELERRKLVGNIQCVTYSADFPTSIDIQTDIQPLGKLPIFYTSRASLNALTYFFANVQTSDPNYIDLVYNKYARRELVDLFVNPLGKLTEERWALVQEKIVAKEHRDAADLLIEILKEYPGQFPVAYVIAAQYAAAGDKAQAIAYLEKAISLGWTAGGYLKADEQFASLRDDSEFQLLLLSLDDSLTKYQPSVGFDFKRAWANNGVPDAKLGQRYLLSTVLAVTRGAGTTVKQAVDNLERSASADFTQPSGGFYFCLTSDVRTTTREPGFKDAIETLQAMGFRAEIVKDSLPKQRPDVLGAMIGTPNFDWPKCGSTLLPGSIAENLTSVGAVMNSLGGQTKLTELLKAGAAGSSGTVTEPYAMQPKFPHPQLYVHYARGLSLAETFYLSVTGPYQLLIMGDPLCQPFAAPPKLLLNTDLRQLDDEEVVRLPLKYETQAAEGKRPPQSAVALSIKFDNASIVSGAVKPYLDVRLQDQPPGYHEIRVVSVGDDATFQRSEVTIPVWIGKRGDFSFEIKAPPTVLFTDRSVKIHVIAKTAEKLSLWHDEEQLGLSVTDDNEFEVPLDALGLGPVRLHARAELPDGRVARSEPLILKVTP